MKFKQHKAITGPKGWTFETKGIYVDWGHFNPEYTYSRVLHVQIGSRLVFSIGIAE